MKPARIDVVPGLKEKVAEAYARGMTQVEIAELAGVSDRGTVAAWLKRPDMVALTAQFVDERATKVLRHTDTAIEKKLEQAGEKISIDTLLKIRQAFAGNTVNLNVDADEGDAMQEMIKKLHDNPEIAALLLDELDASAQ